MHKQSNQALMNKWVDVLNKLKDQLKMMLFMGMKSSLTM